MKKITLLKFLGIILIGVVVILLIPNPSKQVNVKLCDAIDNWHEKLRCINGVAVKKSDVELCKTIEDDYPYATRDECIRDVAVKTNNSELCKLIKADYAKNGCAQNIAIAKKDKNICQLAYNPELCLIKFAIKFSDLNLCDTVNDKIGCIASITCPDKRNKDDCATKQGCEWREDLMSCCPEKGYICNFTVD